MATADVDRTDAPEVAAEFVAFRAAGERCVGEFRCAECGYGIVSRRTLPPCPMCHGCAWEESPWRPFTRSKDAS